MHHSKLAQQSLITTVTPGSSTREEESRLVNKRRRKRTPSSSTSATTLPPLTPAEREVTICDDQGNTVKTVDMDTLTLTDFADANCGFILWQQDSTASCSDLAPECGDETAASGEDNRDTDRTGRQSVSQFPSWKLKWCPGRVRQKWQFKRWPICCFHPTCRSDHDQADVWDCLDKYYNND